MKIRELLHWRQIANTCLAFAVGSLLVTVLYSVVSAEEPPRRKIIFLFDNSRSMYIGGDNGSGDPHGQAHRMARLLVRYLQSMANDGKYAIGAANFSSSIDDYAYDYRVLMPLKPVEAWSEYDIAQLQPLSCPGADDPRKGVSGRDPCLGTYRSSAIGWAQGELASCPANKDELSCLIVMFTDDQTVETNSETQDNIRQTLQRLPADIDFHIVVFPEDGVSDTVWHQWSNEDRASGEKSLVETPVINTDIGPTTDIYRQLIEMLVVSRTSADATILDLPTPLLPLSRWNAPNVNLVEMDLISSVSVLSETYAIAPDIRVGSKRLWTLPEATEVNAGFETNPTMGMSDVAVLRILTHTAPIQADVAIWPTHPKSSEPIEVRAMVHAGAEIITDSDKLAVVAHINETEAEFEMQPDPSSGFWVATIPAAMRSGELEINVDLVPKGWSMSEGSAISRVTARIRNDEWKAELYVDPITGIEGQLRQLELVIKAGEEIVDVSSRAVVSATLRESGQTVSLNSHNGTWRTTLPITVTQNVDAIVFIEGIDPLQAHSKVYVSQAAIGRVIQSSWSTFPFIPFPGESIEVQVVISTSQPVPSFLYARSGEDMPKLLPLAQTNEGYFVATVPRPWGFGHVELYSDSVRLYGDTTVKGALFVLLIYVLIIVSLFIVVQFIRWQKSDHVKTVKNLNLAVQGNTAGLDSLIETYTVRDDTVVTELAGQLAHSIIQRRSRE